MFCLNPGCCTCACGERPAEFRVELGAGDHPAVEVRDLIELTVEVEVVLLADRRHAIGREEAGHVDDPVEVHVELHAALGAALIDVSDVRGAVVVHVDRLDVRAFADAELADPLVRAGPAGGGATLTDAGAFFAAVAREQEKAPKDQQVTHALSMIRSPGVAAAGDSGG